ncbi:DUF417 family protein [Escherichia coli O19:H7]|uniref:DUF417 family protein n=2 Tax=Pseudomonadota TaxID=1224 RepID=UPI0017F77435|nr:MULTISPECIES: DUF417 family protein [Enterobacteriaceae]HDL6675316.1 DUF417 family protein [Yersinia enterocolitica]HDN9017400.1 DUF417 family protein [Aeromonas salmonicida]EEW1531429.1 DUF417 family protein [Escherichia coli]EEW2162400.1 DUF417 family protein [Escherichia coli]EFE7739801.1 DUF417 family protein [Escherichia coli]
MKNFINGFIRSDYDMVILRLSVITIFMLFGTYKWFDFEVMALEPLISTTWLNILYILFGVHGGSYFLGVVETITFLALIIGFFRPAAGILGDMIVIVTGITTLSLLPQLGKIDSFIIKDVLLIGAGAVLLKYDLKRYLTIRALRRERMV